MSEAEDCGSTSGSDPVDYVIDIGDATAAEAFELARTELNNNNREIALVCFIHSRSDSSLQRIFQEAVDRFEKEHEKSGKTPLFQFQWATCLSTAGREMHSSHCLLQVPSLL